jgi:hypothetical protein
VAAPHGLLDLNSLESVPGENAGRCMWFIVLDWGSGPGIGVSRSGHEATEYATELKAAARRLSRTIHTGWSAHEATECTTGLGAATGATARRLISARRRVMIRTGCKTTTVGKIVGRGVPATEDPRSLVPTATGLDVSLGVAHSRVVLWLWF